ncbi:site-specific integrase [Parafrankia sp. BMG5.11]|uniref:tyrosine-type recombinase/integrase n=1 Tax=Parafrankia sp. BMG5.11 TaxID=222540 RepID=UPI00103DA646|nr:site-specific integrase [Parafrankia sp. BMG5.11]TCJ34694.1 site-specific integrase [Parafrankia sp. BMG5.11]
MTKDPNRKRAKRANGQGSIYQRESDGMWVGAAYVLMPDGTQRRRPVYGKTSDIVRAKLTKIQASSDQGIPAEATGWTMERFLTYWLSDIVTPACKPRTVQGYEVIVRTYLIPQIGKKRLNKLTGIDVRNLLKRVTNTCLCCLHGTDKRRPEEQRRCCAVDRCCQQAPSARLIQQVHSVLRNALSAAMREELVGRNVAKLATVAGPVYKVHRGLNADQASHLLKLAAGERLHALYVLALYLGLRRGEILGLRWEDIDFAEGTLTVRHSLQRVGGRLTLVTPKTKNSERTLPLLELIATVLEEHRARQQAEREAAGEDWQDTGLVFTSTVGTPFEPDNLRRSWEPLRVALGLEDLRFHDIRHTCVTLLLNAKVPPHIVREIAGHAKVDVTMEIYAHASLEDKRAALQKLVERLA